MTKKPGREVSWQAVLSICAGLLLSFASIQAAPFIAGHVLWFFLLLLMGGLGAWFEVSIQPYGSLNLSPVVFLTTASALSLWEGIIVAVLSPLLAVLAKRLAASRLDIRQSLSAAGESSLSLFLGAGAVNVLQALNDQLHSVVALAGSTLLFAFFLTAMRITVVEGVSVNRLMGPLARKAFPHLAVMLASVFVVTVAFSVLGPLGIALSVVVMIETYYPWKLLGEQRDLFLGSLQMMAGAVDLKDPYTANHSRRVANSSVMLARILDVPEEEVERIRIGALMHDIGKIAVPGSVIRKPSRLTGDEMDLMKTHVEIGANLIEGLEILQESAQIVMHHHENYDGSGYPFGLVGEAIPIGSRIVFVADAFDALTTDRPYRKGRSPSEAIGVMEANSDTQFDPKVVEALIEVTKKDR